MIGFIGLGSMGGAIVSHLLSKGEELIAFDQNKDVLQRYVNEGAAPGHSVRDIADRVEMLVVCLPGKDASLKVAKEAAKGGKVKIYAELSTIGGETMGKINAILGSNGIQLVDAPVSGGRLSVEKGTLSVMLSGPDQALKKFEKIAGSFAGKITRIGSGVGQAQLCKLVNNSLNFTALLVSCEAVTVGVKAGIKAPVLLDAINAGTGRNSATADKIPRAILPRTFDLGGPLAGVVKDLDLYLSSADSAGLPRGLISHTREMWNEAIKEMNPLDDASNIIRYFEDLLDIEVKEEGVVAHE